MYLGSLYEKDEDTVFLNLKHKKISNRIAKSDDLIN